MVSLHFIFLGLGLLFRSYASMIPVTIDLPTEPAMTMPAQDASNSSTPHFVIYSDLGAGSSSPPPPSTIKVRELFSR